MNSALAPWSQGLQKSAAAAAGLLGGRVDAWTILAMLGLLCLVAGAVLASGWREKQVVWMLPLIVLASLGPVVLSVASTTLGWFGAGFAAVAGAVLLPLATGLIANDATHRQPVWLLGGFATILAVTCCFFGFGFDFSALS